MSPPPKPRRGATALLLLATLLAPAAARAADPDDSVLREPGHHHRPQQLSVLALVRPDAAALGVNFALPVAHDGLIPHVNDALAVELSLQLGAWRDRYYWVDNGDTALSLAFGAGVRWDFYLTQNWSVFAALKLGLEYGLPPYDPTWIVPMGGLGAHYRLDDALLLRLELGYPGGLGVGVAFLFDRP